MKQLLTWGGAECYSLIEVGYFSNKPSQIFNPVSLSVSVSDDGATWTEVASVTSQPEGEFEPDGLKSMCITFPAQTARYLKVVAGCLPYVPEWHHYPGRKASLFIDEIIVN